jgi:RNA polymerase subunit RPABC4/transcription elongation factor Spt4
VENLRFCNWCDQLAPKDLNDCPTCGRRMAPIPQPAE